MLLMISCYQQLIKENLGDVLSKYLHNFRGNAFFRTSLFLLVYVVQLLGGLHVLLFLNGLHKAVNSFFQEVHNFNLVCLQCGTLFVSELFEKVGIQVGRQLFNVDDTRLGQKVQGQEGRVERSYNYILAGQKMLTCQKSQGLQHGDLKETTSGILVIDSLIHFTESAGEAMQSCWQGYKGLHSLNTSGNYNKEQEYNLLLVPMQYLSSKNKPSRPSIAQKNNRYFTESQSAQQVDASVLANTKKQSPFTSAVGPPEMVPRPDYNLHSHIRTTSYPRLEQDRREAEFMESKEKNRRPNAFIKVEEGDTTAENIDIEPITQNYRSSNSTKARKDQTENQLKQIKSYIRTESKISENTQVTPPIKLRELPTERSKNLNRSRERLEFSSDIKTYSKQMEYNMVVTRTLEQTIDENIELKMENEQLREMYREALKSVANLQQIIEDNYGKSADSKVAFRRLDEKELYSNIYPYDHINKVIKPSLQAELKLYREKEEKFREDIKKTTRTLEEELVKAKTRENEYKQINQFLKKENANLHNQLRDLKEGNAERERSLDETQRKNIELLSQPEPKKFNKEQISKLIETFYNQKVVFIANQTQRTVDKLQQRCKQMEKVLDNLLQERRSRKEGTKKIKAQTGEIDNQHVSQSSEILEESGIQSKVIRQKSGKQAGKLKKNYEQKSTNTLEVLAPPIPQEKIERVEKPKQKEQKMNQQYEKLVQGLKIRVMELETKLTQKEKLKEVQDKFTQQNGELERFKEQLINLKKSLQTCNMENFKHLYNQFSQILQQKRHITLKLFQAEELCKSKNGKVWQLQRELNEVKKKKRELIDRCIHLQNYIQKNINNGNSSSSFVIDGLYDHHFTEEEGRNNLAVRCLCQIVDSQISYDEDEGKCALQWINHLEKTMVGGVATLQRILASFYGTKSSQ